MRWVLDLEMLAAVGVLPHVSPHGENLPRLGNQFPPFYNKEPLLVVGAAPGLSEILVDDLGRFQLTRLGRLPAWPIRRWAVSHQP